MPEIINLEDINKKYIIERIKHGDIFIYPTDSVYALGCNALKRESVRKIKEIKNGSFLSVVAPNKNWIYQNFEVLNRNFVKKLPGPYTYVFNTKKKAFSNSINSESKAVGIRLLNHPFSDIIKKAGIPFVVEDIELKKKKARNIKDIPKKILNFVDIVIDGGYLHSYPSTIIDLTSEIAKIVKR
jgi:tRNA threonylcarbamoyl adenosine modification protein (Sua5/YciO/YrdC/YwlC family)